MVQLRVRSQENDNDERGRALLENLEYVLTLDVYDVNVLSWLIRCIMIYHGTVEMEISPAAIWEGCDLGQGRILPPVKMGNTRYFTSLRRLEGRGFINRELNREDKVRDDPKRMFRINVAEIEHAILHDKQRISQRAA